jgi:pimeloyl-ACP methyl ester carboxylesterase
MGQSSKYWLPYLLDFYEDFEVYLIDLQGHGRSDLFDPNWSINSVANYLNDLIEYLELDRIKSIGLSYVGDVLFQLVVISPKVIESMIIIGAIGTWDCMAEIL